MYRVIIVDNEESVRERLLFLLSKMNSDFEVVGSFENGYDALLSMNSLSPDLVITDIKMPYVDGIELIKQSKIDLPLLQFIIISGYDLFDYAKQAIELGVLSYITKPISYEDLSNALSRAKSELDKKLYVDTNIENLQNKIDKVLKIIQDNDLNKLVTLKEIPQNFKEKLIADQIDLEANYFLLGCFDFDDDADSITYEQNELVNFYLDCYIKDSLNDKKFANKIKFITFTKDNETNIFILSKEKIVVEEIRETFSEIITKIRKTCGVSLSIGFSELEDLIVQNINYTQLSYRRLYRHAKRVLEYRTVVGQNIVLFYDDIDKNNSSSGKVDENEYKTINYEILYGRIDIAIEKIKSILNNVTPETFKDTYFFVLNNLLDAILNSCISLVTLYDSFMPHIDIVYKLFNSKTGAALFQFLSTLVYKIDEINKSQRLNKVDTSFSQITFYLEQNYKNPTLSLEDVANKLGYSLSYISAIFKKNNTSFTKYLTDLRMNKALLILKKDDAKLINVASEVGYDDPYYFSHCFKKHFGVSPLDYRKKWKNIFFQLKLN